jgi:DNA-binding NarL/FixJ family response regulator
MSEKIYVSEDGVKREATASEIAQFEQDRIEREAATAEKEAKQAARQSALAKLAALGLTEAEIAAL